ncbi:WD40/YVTN/BNR-like repeat-containing protein [Thauera aromatica]|uniref:PSII_BNR super family protein n=1 Tax=Thauera aromatica K172 TaxID=44139 RepID=A0A2R4BIH9_THAAR|nr:YCF48-related protein [Thauera aromatica]AVR87125.1 PSII_BNR super family protein [Thauera aromatica K172]
MKSTFSGLAGLRRVSFGVLAALLAGAVSAAGPVVDALDRPAVRTAQAAHAVLLGAAQAGDSLIAVGERGIIVRSDDQGASWQQISVPVSVTLTAVRFADARHGYAVGHGGTVLTTSDGGQAWERRLDGRQIARMALEAAQKADAARAVREAEQLVADGPDKPLLDVLVFDHQRAVVVGAYGLAFATDDGGRTWASWMDRLDNPRGFHLYAIRRHGERLLVVGEQGLVRFSEDGGRTFAPIQTPYGGSFFTAELPAEDVFVTAGLRGNVWRSMDAGASWMQLPVPMPASITGSALRADGSPVFVNQAGMVLGELDGALVPVNATPLPSLNGVLPKPDGTLLALGIHGAVSVKPGDQK